MTEYDDVVNEVSSFIDRARKAVVGAATTAVSTGLGVTSAAIVADGLSVEAVAAGVAAGALAGLAALKLVYETRNRARR